MATMHPRRWKTSAGKPRSGYEVVWNALIEGKLRRKRKLFSGTGAKVKANAFRIALDENGSGSDLTVTGASKQWIRSREQLGREKSTTVGYQQHLDDHILPTLIKRPNERLRRRFGEIPLAELRPADCALLRTVLLDKLSIKTTRKVMTSLRMLLGHAAATGTVARNAAADIRVEVVDRGEDSIEIPSPDELERILKACRTEALAPPTFTEVWTVFGIMTGLRPSEQRALAIEDLILDGAAPGFMVRFRADKWQQIGSVKTKRSRRWIPLGPTTIALLRRWLLVAPRCDGFDDPERSGRKLYPLFPTVDGTIQSLANIYNRVWKPLLDSAGLAHPPDKREIERAKREKRPPFGQPFYSINCRRHLAASIRIDEGWDVKRVADFLGHSSPVVTLNTYAHLFRKRERQQDDATAIEKKLLG